MPQEPIPFVPDQQSGWSMRAGGSPLAVNVVVDGRGAVRRRPGIAAYGPWPVGEGSLPVALTTAVSGLWVALNDDIYAVDSASLARHIYNVKPTVPPAFRDLSIDAATGTLILERGLLGTGRPVFAETEAMLAIAGGNEIEKVPFASNVPARLGGSPPKASHIIANASRLLANDVATSTSRSFVFYSAPGSGSVAVPPSHETWSPSVGAGFFSAEARPDNVRALYENTNEVFVFGDTTLQVFGSDPTFVYGPLPAKNHGLVGPYAAIEADQRIAFLDHRRRFCITDGRSLDYIGEPIQAVLDDMPTVSDVFGYRVRTDVLDCLCWCFPTDGRTFVYQINVKGPAWSLWMGWDESLNNWKRFAVNAHHHRHTTGDNLVGLTDGRVGILSMDSADDFGEPINGHIETGFIDHGTDLLKQCIAVHLALKRGEHLAAGATAPTAWLKWRDQPGAVWQAAPISLGASGDREIVIPLRSLGVYRRRQWLFEFAGAADLELTRATEVFETLQN